MNQKKKNLFILLGVIVVVVIIIIVAASKNKNMQAPTGEQNTAPATEETASTPAEEGDAAVVDENAEAVADINPVLVDSVVEVPGANPITKDNKVVTQEGELVKNDVVPMSPEAPQQTAPVDKESLSNEVLKVEITANGFNPNEFTVKKGAAVTLGVSSGDKYTHVFMFDDDSLSAVAVGVGPNETRAISFNAPETAGEYAFHCDVPGHAGRGEVGKMIVK